MSVPAIGYYVSHDTTISDTQWMVCEPIGHEPGAEQAGVGHSVVVARCFTPEGAERIAGASNTANPNAAVVEAYPGGRWGNRGGK